MAVISGALAPVAGRMSDRVHPRGITAVGIGLTSASLLWLALVMHPDTQTWLLLLPMALMGVGNAFMWGPLGATATRNLPLSSAGAGSGVYNTTRQVGAVLGSAAIAAVIQARLSADLPGMPSDLGGMQASGDSMPARSPTGSRRRCRSPCCSRPRCSSSASSRSSSSSVRPATRTDLAATGWRTGLTGSGHRPRAAGVAADVDDHPLGDHPGVGLQHVQGHAGEVLLPVDEG